MSAICGLCDPPQAIPEESLEWHLWFEHDFTQPLSEVEVEETPSTSQGEE